MTTGTRMIFAFARDGGLIHSSTFASVDPRLGMPLNALYLTTAGTMLFGLVFLVSTTAFNAIGSASVVGLSLSYALVVLVHCIQGRNKLPPRKFALPPAVGWTANVVGICYSIISSFLFLLPPKLPVTSSTMNYGAVAFVLFMCLAGISWVVRGKNNYRGPVMAGYQRI
jgi:amino acid transporter